MSKAVPTALEGVYIVLPLVTLTVFCIWLIYLGASSPISDTQVALAVLAAVVAAGSSFLAYFEDRVRNGYAWAGILLNGLLTIVVFAAIHRSSGIMCASVNCTDANLAASGDAVRHYTDMASAAYFSAVTFTTLGYGDMQPVPDRRLIAASEALIGYLYLGFLVGAAFHWTSQPKSGKT